VRSWGGGTGAVLGAGIGALAGGKTGAIMGGALGARGRSGHGCAHWQLHGQARKGHEGGQGRPGSTARGPAPGEVQFRDPIRHRQGQLKPASEHDLSEFAQVLKQYKDTDLVIEGHTDNKGKKASNQKLSVARADAVIAFLESQGVERVRMSGRGYADDMPVASNDTEEGRAQNRRVQVQIAANEQLKQQDAASGVSRDSKARKAHKARARWLVFERHFLKSRPRK